MNKSILSLAILGSLAIQPLSVFADDKPSAPAFHPFSKPIRPLIEISIYAHLMAA